jgi:glycosyltransferase involved in cell wall biosynthesis
LNSPIIFSANTSWYLFNFRKNTLKSFINDGYKVFCLCPEDDYTKKLQEIGCIWIPLEMHNHGLNPLKDLKLLFIFIATYFKIKPQAVFHFTIKNNVYGTIASYILKIPSINNISGLGTVFIHDGLKYKIARILYKSTLRLSSKVFCQNTDDFNFISQNYLVRGSRLELLPGSGVDLERFKCKAELQIKDSPFIFIYSGRFLYDKGLEELITAFTQLDQMNTQSELWLIGFQDSKNISAIHDSKIKEWSLMQNISILKPSSEIENILEQAHCFVLPSYREGMPRSILEACAMQLPIICTDVPGCREIVTDELNGFLCAPKDSYALILAMRKMLGLSKKQRSNMGSNGREIVEKSYSETVVIEKTKNAFHSLTINKN